MRSAMALIRLSSSVVSCAGSGAANNAATAGASMNIRMVPRFLMVLIDETWPGAGYRTGAGPPTNEELSGRRARIAGSEEDLARRVKARESLQPGQRKDGPERRRRHGGSQQRRSEERR